MIPGLSEKELSEITLILKKFPGVSEAFLFGSRALGTFKIGSDVDIALKGHTPFQLVAGIKALLEEESPMPYMFDVVDYQTIENPAFRKHIDKYGKLIYKQLTGPRL